MSTPLRPASSRCAKCGASVGPMLGQLDPRLTRYSMKVCCGCGHWLIAFAGGEGHYVRGKDDA